jgi:type I restriction enzyme S subunit
MSFKKYKLKDLIDNFSVRARDYGGSEGLEFLGVSNEDGIVKSKSAAEHKGEEYKIIEKGCFAYNPYRINIGSIAYHNEDIKGLISPAYVIFKTKPNSIKDNLLFKFLKSAEGLRQIKFHGRGTVRQALRFEDLCKIEISIPTFEKQEKLISNIEKTEYESNLIFSELTHQLDLIKQLRQAFLREAMQGKLVNITNVKETGQQLLAKIKAEKTQLIVEKKLKKEREFSPITKDEIPFEIPEHWIWCRLGEICGFITKGTTPPLEKIKFDEKIPYLKVYNIVNQKINFTYKPQFIDEDTHQNVLTRSIVYPNDVLMNIVGPPLGKVAIVPSSYPQWNINQALAIFRPLQIKINTFLYYYLREGSQIQGLIPLGVVGQDNLSLEQCNNLIFPLPPLHEQEQIVKKLEELMSFCDGLEQSIKESQEYNEMLLQQVLREALQPKENTKIINIESRKIGNPLKTILAGHIINLNNTTDFGRVKFQKLLFLTEYICKIDFDSHYIQKVAGPYDDVLIKGIEADFNRMRFFNVVQDNTDNKRVRYHALAGATELESLFQENFPDELVKINNTLLKFRPLSWGECELIATLYAVWNNRIIKNEPITDELLYNDFMAWDKQKSKYQSVFHKWLFWMKDERIIPDGWGKYIDKPQ